MNEFYEWTSACQKQKRSGSKEREDISGTDGGKGVWVKRKKELIRTDIRGEH